MIAPPLQAHELELVREVLRKHPEVTSAKIFGSRAKGTHRPSSDVDLVLWGEMDALRAEAIAAELDELPLPYQYDVLLYTSIQSQPLRDHIERVGIQVYPEPPQQN